jgi:hypothetical protein
MVNPRLRIFGKDVASFEALVQACSDELSRLRGVRPFRFSITGGTVLSASPIF